MDKTKTLIVIFIGILVIAIVLGISFFSEKTETQKIISQSNSQENDNADISIVAQNLEIPWEIVFLPDSRMLITERPGRLLLIGRDKQTIEISGVVHSGEGGLLGLALHPNFASNHWLYLYSTFRESGRLMNRVERYRLDGTRLVERQVMVDGILAAANHDGGRMVFGPDGKLYVTTGDAEQPTSAQDKNSLNGKILRVSDDGSGLEVYSYGHRNPQGLAWDNQGRLWATEHGPSGTASGWDEVNLIGFGKNYGWPEIKGEQTKAGMVTPVIQSGSDDTWAPSGMVIVGDQLLFTGLRGEAVYSARIDGDKLADFKRHFVGEWGRLRTIKLGPDGWFYLLTNNRDGRGKVGSGDDKIIRIKADQLLDK